MHLKALKAQVITVPSLKIWVAWSYTPSEDLMKHDIEHVKKVELQDYHLVLFKIQWKSSDNPSIDYYAIIIVVYYKK